MGSNETRFAVRLCVASSPSDWVLPLGCVKSIVADADACEAVACKHPADAINDGVADAVACEAVAGCEHGDAVESAMMMRCDAFDPLGCTGNDLFRTLNSML